MEESKTLVTMLRILHKVMIVLIFVPLTMFYTFYELDYIVLGLSVIVILEVVYFHMIMKHFNVWSKLMNIKGE